MTKVASLAEKRMEAQQDIADVANRLILEAKSGSVDAVIVIMSGGGGISMMHADGVRRLTGAERIGMLSIARTALEIEEIGK